MTQEQIIAQLKSLKIIAQLKSLKSDAESHREKDGTIDDVYADDIEALSTAIDLVKSTGTRAFKVFKLERFCDNHECSDCPISKSIGSQYLCISKAFKNMTMEQLDYLIAKINEAEAVK